MRTTLPARYYVDPQWFAAEMEQLFAGMWICVGRIGCTSRARGDFIRRDVAGASVLDRQRRQRQRRERSTTSAAIAARGSATPATGTFPGSIQCPYHGWTYDLDGRLIGAPQMDDGRRISRATTIRCAAWRARCGTATCSSTLPVRRRAAARSAARSARALRALADDRAADGPPHRVRRARQLEADRAELQRVPALPDHPSAAQPHAPLSRRGQRADDRQLLRRRHGIQGRRRDAERRRPPAARRAARPGADGAARWSTTSRSIRTCC